MNKFDRWQVKLALSTLPYNYLTKTDDECASELEWARLYCYDPLYLIHYNSVKFVVAHIYLFGREYANERMREYFEYIFKDDIHYDLIGYIKC